MRSMRKQVNRGKLLKFVIIGYFCTSTCHYIDRFIIVNAKTAKQAIKRAEKELDNGEEIRDIDRL